MKYDKGKVASYNLESQEQGIMSKYEIWQSTAATHFLKRQGQAYEQAQNMVRLVIGRGITHATHDIENKPKNI